MPKGEVTKEGYFGPLSCLVTPSVFTDFQNMQNCRAGLHRSKAAV